MISARIEVLGVGLDARLLHAASRLGRSIAYFRVDIGPRTAFQWDLEYIS